jgi:hypothetical protein
MGSKSGSGSIEVALLSIIVALERAAPVQIHCFRSCPVRTGFFWSRWMVTSGATASDATLNNLGTRHDAVVVK